MPKSIYLDYAAATPVAPEAVKAMEPYFSQQFYNPSALYLRAKQVRRALEDARSVVASCIGCRSAEIIFTAGATEANNLAIQGVMRKYPKGEVLVSSIEHESVLEPAKLFGYKTIPVDSRGRVDLAKFEKMVSDNTVLVSVGYVNNELGTVQPLTEIAKILNKSSISRGPNKLPLYFHTDAAQAPCYFPLQASRLGVDLMSLNGGKIYGPKQSGVLFTKAGTDLAPQILGGGQEFGLRSGTENVPAAVGFSVALRRAQTDRQLEAKRVLALRYQFIQALPKHAKVNGGQKAQSPHILSVTFPRQDNERMVMMLDETGVQAASGSACSAASDEASHVLRAIGFNDSQSRATLRFSFGRQTTASELERVAKLLDSIVSV